MEIDEYLRPCLPAIPLLEHDLLSPIVETGLEMKGIVRTRESDEKRLRVTRRSTPRLKLPLTIETTPRTYISCSVQRIKSISTKVALLQRRIPPWSPKCSQRCPNRRQPSVGRGHNAYHKPSYANHQGASIENVGHPNKAHTNGCIHNNLTETRVTRMAGWLKSHNGMKTSKKESQ